MVDENKQAKKQKLMRKMKKERGYLQPTWAYMIDKDVDFMASYDELYERGADRRQGPACQDTGAHRHSYSRLQGARKRRVSARQEGTGTWRHQTGAPGSY